MIEELNLLLFSALALLFSVHFFFELMISQRSIELRNNNPESAILKYYLKFYLRTFASLFFMFRVFTVGPVVFVYFGFLWVPQIAHNVHNNTSRAPHWIFVAATSLIHLFLPMYVMLDSNNIYFLRPRPQLALVTFMAHCAVLAVLIIQKMFGPRFFYPNAWVFWQ